MSADTPDTLVNPAFVFALAVDSTGDRLLAGLGNGHVCEYQVLGSKHEAPQLRLGWSTAVSAGQHRAGVCQVAYADAEHSAIVSAGNDGVIALHTVAPQTQASSSLPTPPIRTQHGKKINWMAVHVQRRRVFVADVATSAPALRVYSFQ